MNVQGKHQGHLFKATTGQCCDCVLGPNQAEHASKQMSKRTRKHASEQTTSQCFAVSTPQPICPLKEHAHRPPLSWSTITEDWPRTLLRHVHIVDRGRWYLVGSDFHIWYFLSHPRVGISRPNLSVARNAPRCGGVWVKLCSWAPSSAERSGTGLAIGLHPIFPDKIPFSTLSPTPRQSLRLHRC